MKKLFSILKKWHADKALLVLSGKDVLILILTIAACGLFLTAQSIKHSREQDKWDQQRRERESQRDKQAQQRDQRINEKLNKLLEKDLRHSPQKKEPHQKKAQAPNSENPNKKAEK